MADEQHISTVAKNLTKRGKMGRLQNFTFLPDSKQKRDFPLLCRICLYRVGLFI